MSTHSHAPAQWPDLPRSVLVIGMLLSLWLVLPSVTSVHLEGVTSQMQSIAWLMANAPGTPHDPHMPLVTQYIYQAKAGVVDLLYVIFRVAPNASDWAFRGLMLASFALLVWASLHCARHWGRVPTWLGWFALVLVPGLVEISFFFNDNLPSAALATAALACMATPKATWVRCVSAGALMAMAMLCRIDAVFALPIVLGAACCAPEASLGWRRWLAPVWVGLSLCLSLLLLAAVHGFSVVDVWVIGKQFSQFLLMTDIRRLIATRRYFLGLMAAPLWAIGVIYVWRKCPSPDDLPKALWRLTFVIYPLLLFCFAPRVTEIRYVLPLLAPILAWQVGLGLGWVLVAWKTSVGAPRWLAIALLVWVTLLAVLPPMGVVVLDGPRAFVGRSWTPYLWRQWQGASELSMQRLSTLTSALSQAEQSVVISSHFNDEFYLRLRLIESGFKPVPVQSAFPGCGGFAVMQKGSRTVMHVRTDPQYVVVPIWINDNAALQADSALGCTGWKAGGPVYVTVYGQKISSEVLEVYGLEWARFERPVQGDFFTWETHLGMRKPPQLIRKFELLDYVELTEDEQQRLRELAHQRLVQHPFMNAQTQQPFTLSDYQRAYQARPGPTQAFWDKLGWVILPPP